MPASASAVCSSAMRMPAAASCSLASSSASSASSARKCVSPSIAYSIAGRSSAGVSCATWEIRHADGKSISPPSTCNSPIRRAKRLVLPAPFGPTRPIFSPGFKVASAFSNSGFVPRMSENCWKRIMLCQDPSIVQPSAGKHGRPHRKWRAMSIPVREKRQSRFRLRCRFRRSTGHRQSVFPPLS